MLDVRVSYFYGLGCDKHPGKCWEYLQISGDEYDYVLAICIMAECAAVGFGLAKPDKALALKYNKRASDLGYEGTCLPTANSFLYGVGTTANPEEALKYYKLAAHCQDSEEDADSYDGKGNAQAMYFVAACYMEGVGVPNIDETKAIRWLKRSADKGNRQAIEYLAQRNCTDK